MHQTGDNADVVCSSWEGEPLLSVGHEANANDILRIRVPGGCVCRPVPNDSSREAGQHCSDKPWGQRQIKYASTWTAARPSWAMLKTSPASICGGSTNAAGPERGPLP